MKRKHLAFLLFIPLGFVLGCQSTMINMTKPIMIELLVKPAFDAFLEEDDVELAFQAIGGQLKLVEIMKQKINRNEVKLLLCRGFASYGLLLEPRLNRLKYKADNTDKEDERKQLTKEVDKLTARIRRMALRGRSHCFNMIEAKYPGFLKAMEKGQKDYHNILKKMTKADVDIMFWAGFGWGYALINGLSETDLIAKVPQLKALMHRIVELDGTYFYGAGHLFLATLYAQSKTLGGDLKKSNAHFEKAYKHSNNKLLLVDLYKARFYAKQATDTAMCKKLLTKIKKTSVHVFPKVNLMNALAKELGEIASLDVDEFCP